MPGQRGRRKLGPVKGRAQSPPRYQLPTGTIAATVAPERIQGAVMPTYLKTALYSKAERRGRDTRKNASGSSPSRGGIGT